MSVRGLRVEISQYEDGSCTTLLHPYANSNPYYFDMNKCYPPTFTSCDASGAIGVYYQDSGACGGAVDTTITYPVNKCQGGDGDYQMVRCVD